MQHIADRLFDFPEMARRALARHWRERTPQEQNEFVIVFKQLLARAYLGKLENYAGEQTVYLGETVDGEFATVHSKIVTSRGSEIPVDYRLHQVGSRWVVYDVAVSGVSFVGNYRGAIRQDHPGLVVPGARTRTPVEVHGGDGPLQRTQGRPRRRDTGALTQGSIAPAARFSSAKP